MSKTALTPEQIEAITAILNNDGSNRKAAREVLNQESRESTIRGYISRGDIVVDEAKESLKTTPTKVSTSVAAKEEPVEAYVFNVKTDVYHIETVTEVGENITQLMIPDPQVKPDIPLDYLDWLGEYIVEKKPEVIVNIGDFADMPSLSSYDKGKGKAEGKRVQKDIEAAIEGMNRLLKPLYDLQQAEIVEYGSVQYKPKMVLTLGNHEERIMRHVNDNPELQGFLSYDNLRYKDFGWEVFDFLEPVMINGFTYVHYMANPMSGKPYGGAALNVLKNVGESFCMGHKQCLDIATRFLPSSGRQQWAIIAGAFYEHSEGYKGYQGNKHFRGIVVKHNVKDGNCNPMIVDMEYLKNRYSK